MHTNCPSDGKMTPSGHNWVQGQGAGPRLANKDDDEEEKFDAMGNKIDSTKKAKKLTSAELRKKKKGKLAYMTSTRCIYTNALQIAWHAASEAKKFLQMKRTRETCLSLLSPAITTFLMIPRSALPKSISFVHSMVAMHSVLGYGVQVDGLERSNGLFQLNMI